MTDDTADILGGRLVLPPPQKSSSSTFRRIWSLFLYFSLFLGVLVLSLAIYVRVRRIINRWRDQEYRMRLRRRAGIPDHDKRAFTVAAAAAKALADREEARRHPIVIEDSEDEAEKARTALRAPRPETGLAQSGDTTGYYNPRAYNNVQSTRVVPTAAGRPIQQGYGQLQANHAPAPSDGYPALHPLEPTPGRFGHRIPPPDVQQARESHRDRAAEGRQAPAAGTNEQGNSVDGHLAEDDDMDVDESFFDTPKRGSKRSADHDDADSPAFDRADGRDKRARKGAQGQTREEPEEESSDEQSEATSARRGRKRDRAEAGSTIDGEESDADGASNGKTRRRRKRRATSQRNLESTPRGQKRDREAGEESELDRPKKRTSRKKRSKKGEEGAEDQSNDPLCEGRRIGEEWEEDGIHFKVGPNGQRLRLVLLKKSFLKFLMPDDSQHPDREASFDIYVEKWLSEEEFKTAQEKGMVADVELKLDTSLEHGDPHAGKTLLWRKKISTALESAASKSSASEHSSTSSTGPRVNPFLRPPSRRTNSAFQTMGAKPSSLHLPLPQTSRPSWEKEQLEAASFARLHERAAALNGTNGQSPTPAPAPASAPALAPAPALVSAPAAQPAAPRAAPQAPSIPSLFDKPAEKPAQQSSGQPAAPTLFGFPSTPASAPTAAPTAPAPTPATPAPASQAPKSTPLFGFSALSNPAPTSAPAPAPAAPITPTKPALSNPFATPTKPASNNFFATPPASSSSPSQLSHKFFTQQGTQQSIQPTSTTPSGAPPRSNSFQFGSTPATAAPAVPASPSPATNFFGAPASGPQPGATSGAFGVPAATSQPASSSAGLFGSASPHNNAFGNAFKPQEQTAQAPPGGSLLARLGPPAPQTQSAPTTTATTTPKFSFGQPSSVAAPSASATSGPALNSGPKFSFGVSNSATTSTPSAFGALQTSAPPAAKTKPAAGPSKFAFPPHNSASTTAPAFGAPAFGTSTPSAFGASSMNASATPSSTPASASNGASPSFGFTFQFGQQQAGLKVPQFGASAHTGGLTGTLENGLPKQNSKQ